MDLEAFDVAAQAHRSRSGKRKRPSSGSNSANPSPKHSPKNSKDIRVKKPKGAENNEPTSPTQNSVQPVSIDTTTAPLPHRSRHVRFSSQEPDTARETQSSAPPVAHNENKGNDDESDSDSAPEDVRVADARSDLQAAAVASSRAAEQQRTEARKKRREKDERLKTQAVNRRKNSKKNERARNGDGGSGDEEDTVAGLLPQSLLESVGALPDRSPTPTGEEDVEDAGKKARERKLDPQTQLQRLTRLPKKPKDRRVGRLTVSVLEKNSGVLAPKQDPRSRILRQSWLDGRTGSKGGVARRSYKKGRVFTVR